VKIGAFVVAGLLFPPWALADTTASAAKKEVLVRCDAGQKIKLDKMRPNVVKVSGICQENVDIGGFNDLTIVGMPGATLLPVSPVTAHAIGVWASHFVSIEGLTIRITDGRTAFGLVACYACVLKNVTVDGGTGLDVYSRSGVYVSGFTLTGAGGWTGVGATDSSSLSIADSVFDNTVGGDPNRWSGLWAGSNATVTINRSVFRNFSAGIHAREGAVVDVNSATTVEDNSCVGVIAETGAVVRINGSRVVNNGSSSCIWAGISVDYSATVSITQSEVRENNGTGVSLNHHALVSLGAGTVISHNTYGLGARNGSLAVAPGGPGTDTIEISGNQPDLFCDSLSHINNGDRITGATQVQCQNLHAGDDPP
jgi:hypothetical protein